MVAPDSESRAIDAFVGSLDLAAMGFGRVEAVERRCSAFEPVDLLGIYVYGCRNGVRSSCKPERACEVNVEAMWLIGELKPDFRTSADFRRKNTVCLKAVREFAGSYLFKSFAAMA